MTLVGWLARTLCLVSCICLAGIGCGGDSQEQSDGGQNNGEGDGGQVCNPTTCAEEGIQCGEVDDGCGALLDCGGCFGEACIAGECILLDCGETETNECGGCVEQVATAGDPCPCGALVASCDDYELICDDGNGFQNPQVEPPTDDSIDEFTEVVGTLEGGPIGQPGYDSDYYEIFVDDTFFGILEPALEIDYDTASEIRVCINYNKEEDGIVLPTTALTCRSGDQTDTKIRSCCLEFPPGSETIAIDGILDFGNPNFTDGDGTWRIRIEHTNNVLPTSDACQTYTLRYHF